ncbi:MAG: hypothetical protein B1H09_02775 [Gemmatimonadaceae bacterium 4484_173]|jgi:hypothetical protein|nr:MAG: hypothetical protein B1H09_02775 [Gemmatimonadaceae bacterium 4484_173]RKZ03461.1 MAG: hypothetical protein DRQ21_05695 [Candidatus Fermentibacteria bacterium]
MKYFVFFVLAVLVAGCGGNQPDTDPAINLPSGETAMENTPSGLNAPNITGGINRANQEVCRTNMLTASASISMYQAQHGTLPETLAEAGIYAICPEAGEFRYNVDGQNWTLECPADPSHGSVHNGVSSW